MLLELRLLNKNQKARAKQIISNYLTINGVPKEFFYPIFRQNASSYIRDTKILVKTQNYILHLLVEVNDTICASFPFLSGWLEITFETLLACYTFTNFNRGGLKSLVLCLFFSQLELINSLLRT